MAISLAKLCENAERKYNLKLIAGKSGLDTPVRWVHMVEDREVPDFLHGNELVFTTGIGHLGQTELLLAFAQSLKQHSGAGLVINLGPYIREVPQSVAEYCDKNHLPLFTLPWEVHIIDITYDFCRCIIENEKTEISTVEAFKNLIAFPEKQEQYADICDKSGFDRQKPLRVIMLDFQQNGHSVTEALERNQHIKLWRLLTRSSRAASMFLMGDQILVIKQQCSPTQIKRMTGSLAQHTGNSNLTFFMGVSEEAVGYDSVARLYKQAKAALITAFEQHESVTMYADIGINQVIFGVEDRETLEAYANTVLDLLTTYDEQNKTNYLDMLYEYLENNGSVKAVAEKCGVHRNTVNYKIKQIREILGVELTDSKKAELLLAFRIRALLKYRP